MQSVVENPRITTRWPKKRADHEEFPTRQLRIVLLGRQQNQLVSYGGIGDMRQANQF